MSASPVNLRLFGPLQLGCGGADAQPLPWQRPLALLALLACSDGWVAREHLALRLRPDAAADGARAHLRRLLHRLRDGWPGAAAGVEVEPARLRWAGASDVRAFRAALARQDWEQALALHAAPLLAGVAPLGDAAFDDWLEDERLALRRRWRAAAVAAAQARAARGDAAGTLALMQRLLEDDPLDEEVVQAVLAQAAAPAADEAQRSLALQAHAELARRLALDMGLKPLPATAALVERLRQGRVAAPPPASPPLAPEPRATAAREPLFGREAEIERIEALLQRPDVTWVSLCGPGGIGKTRLARELLARAGAAATWVPLSEAHDELALHRALAEALGLAPASGALGPRLQASLAGHRGLIVLDNVEQLQHHAAALQALLQAAPGLRWLATTREVLGLAGEHVVALDGLATQGPDSPALALLAAQADRQGCPLDPRDASAMTAAQALLQRLQGLPLAIELAAAWLPVMPLPMLARSVAQDLDFLASDQVARPPAHRSLRAVFDGSWQRLGAPLREALSALSVFEGSFDLAAAAAVAPCDARTLLQLAGRSMLRREAAGVFALHPLVRQFAAEAADADSRDAVRARHARHFLHRVAEPPRLVPGDGDARRIAELLPLLPDLAAAWRHAVETQQRALLAHAQPALDGLLALTGRLEEASQLSALAADALPAADPLRGQMQAWQLASLVTLDRVDAARALAQALWAQGDRLPPGPRCTVAATFTRLAHDGGDVADALHWATLALQLAEQAALPVARMRCLQNLGAVRWVAGDAEGSERAWRAMLALAEDHGSERQRARALRGLGVLAQGRGRLDEACALLEQAVAGFERLDDRVELSQAQRSLSYAWRERADPARQLHWAEAAAASGRRVGLVHVQLPNEVALAAALEACGERAAAQRQYLRSLRLARRHGMRPLVLRCLFSLAALDGEDAGRRAHALATLHAVRADPALRHADGDEVVRRIEALNPGVAEVQAAIAAAAALDLDAVALDWLARIDDGA